MLLLALGIDGSPEYKVSGHKFRLVESVAVNMVDIVARRECTKNFKHKMKSKGVAS